MVKVVMALVAASGIALALTPVIKQLAFKIGAVDAPAERKVHSKVMPRLGGLAIYLAFVATILIFFPLNQNLIGLIAGTGVIVLLGVVDDIWGVSPKVKLLGQIAAALVLVAFGIRIEFITNPFVTSPFDGVVGQLDLAMLKLSIPFTVFWIVGITNAVNLIDGLDGLAAGVAIISALTLAVIGWLEAQLLVSGLAVVLAASTLGFLKYNFYPAKIFMGDSGSMFLGFTLATLAILGLGKGATVISLVIPIVILGVPIMDTTFAILRRYLNKQPIFKADKDHLHHRLLALGLSHRQTVLSIYGLSFVLAGSAILLTILTTAQGVMILTGLFLAILLGADRIGVVSLSLKIKEEQKSFNQGGK